MRSFAVWDPMLGKQLQTGLQFPSKSAALEVSVSKHEWR